MRHVIFHLERCKDIRYLARHILEGLMPFVKVQGFETCHDMIPEMQYIKRHGGRIDVAVIDCMSIVDTLDDTSFRRLKDVRAIFPDISTILTSGGYDAHIVTAAREVVDAFMKKPFQMASLSTLIVSLLEYPDTHRLTVLLGAPGSGKSTLMDRVGLNGVRKLTKITTRPYRSSDEKDGGEIESISNEEFRFLVESNLVMAEHEYKGNRYGIRANDFFSSMGVRTPHIVAGTCAEPYIELSNMFPRQVRLAFLVPPDDYSEWGLEKRLTQLNLERYKHMVSTRDRINTVDIAFADTIRRLKTYGSDAGRLYRYIHHANIIINEQDLDDRTQTLVNFIHSDRRSTSPIPEAGINGS